MKKFHLLLVFLLLGFSSTTYAGIEDWTDSSVCLWLKSSGGGNATPLAEAKKRGITCVDGKAINNSQKVNTINEIKEVDASDELFNTKEKLTIAQEKLLDTDEKLQIASDELFNTKEKLTIAEEKLRVVNEELLKTKNKLAIAEEKQITSEEKLTIAEDKQIIAEEKLRIANDELLKTENKLAIAEENLREVKEEVALVAEEKRIIEIETTPIAEEITAEASMVTIPANASPSGDWKCNAGFYKINNSCLKLPSNAAAKALTDGFNCKFGYMRSGNTCIVSIPLNASASGDSWKCIAGFYKNKNGCIKLPSNATAKANGDGFYCKTGYEISGNSCRVLIPKNAYAYGDSWECNAGFYKNKNGCIKDETYIDPGDLWLAGLLLEYGVNCSDSSAVYKVHSYLNKWKLSKEEFARIPSASAGFTQGEQMGCSYKKEFLRARGFL